MTARELFIRGVWTLIPAEDDVEWIHHLADQPLSSRPLGDQGDIVRRMLAAGVSARDIARLCRITGYETAFSLLYYLGDSTNAYATFPKGERELNWAPLQALDAETEEIVEEMRGLHESLLSRDPSGREMRPPPRGT